jgi:chromosome segregation ATPase
MEDKLDLILNRLDSLETGFKQEISGVKSQIKHVTEEISGVKSQIDQVVKEVSGVKGQVEHLTKEVFKNSVKAEDSLEATRQELNSKLDRIYNFTVGIAKQFTDTTQEIPVIRFRQTEHANQLEDHEERILKLEAVE